MNLLTPSRPRRVAVVIGAANIAAAAAGAGALGVATLFPHASEWTARLLVLLGLAVTAVLGYALTGFFEEALFRGLILGVLRPAGVWPAVWISSALFGAAHLPNMLFGQAPAIAVAQAVGAFCFGVGYAAVRLHTANVLPLMVLHFLTDLFLRIDALPTWAHWTAMVGGDTLLLIYGLILLRQSVRPNGDAAATTRPTSAAPALLASA